MENKDYNITALIVILGLILIILLVKAIYTLFKADKIYIESSDDDEEHSNYLKCPKCKGKEFFEGPGGGSFGNIQCATCNTKYNNLGPFGLDEIK